MPFILPGQQQTSSGGVDLTTSEGLYQLAQMQGGQIAQVADELTHPTRSILSTIGNGFKNAFKGFVDIISVPQHVVAGMLSSDYTIGEAIDKDISPSDVLFGEKDPNASTMKKVGSFFTRTAADVLLDPLTYLTFGIGKGIQLAAPKAAGAAEALSKIGVTDDVINLNKKGTELFNKAVEMQINGLKATAVKNGTIKGLEGDAMDAFIKQTLDAELSTDFVKNAMSNLIKVNPALVETIVDKGGIKFFGKTLLEGQRINSAIKAIPGFTIADELTKPVRNTLYSLFSNSYSPSGKIPNETIDTLQKWKDISEARKSDLFTKVPAIWKQFGITAQEDDLIRSAVELGKRPADARLAQVYDTYRGFQKKNLRDMWAAGIKVNAMDNYVPHYLLKEKVKSIPFSLPPSQKVKAAGKANIAKFIPKATPETGTLGAFEKPLIGSEKSLGLNVDEATGAITDISGREFERVRATVEEARTLGVEFDPSAVSTLVKGSLDVIKGTTVRHMMKDLAESAGVPASLAPDGYVSVAVKGLGDEVTDFSKFVVGKDGEQLLFHPETAKRIEEFAGAVINDEATNKVLKAFDRMQTMWKASVTSIFPSFHGRNAISNVFLNFLDIGRESLNPASHMMSANIIMRERKYNSLVSKMFVDSAAGNKAKDDYVKLMNETIFKDANGYDWSFGELRRVLTEKNVAFNRNIMGQVDLTKETPDVFNDLFGKKTVTQKAAGVVAAPFKFGQEVVGSTVENHGRLINFITNLKQTGDVEFAAQRTKQFLFDYGNLTKFEKTFLKRIIPFYTFTRKNLELQVKTLMKTPGKISNQLSAIGTLGEVMSGGQLTEEEKNNLPEWIKAGTNILRTKKGSTITMFGSLGTPIEAPFQQFQPNAFLGSVSPLIRVPVEQMTGYSFYQGKALSEVTNAAAYKRAPEAIKKLIGYTEVKGKRKDGTPFVWYVALRPEMMNLISNLPPTTRVLTAMKQIESADIATQDKILQQTIGLRPYAIDLEEEAAKKELAAKKNLESLLIKAGVIGKFQRTFIPKENK